MDDAAELTEAFACGGLLIIEGGSAAGKTRMAYEAIRRLTPRRWLIVPAGPTSLRALTDGQVRLRNAVIWLDDVNDYLAAGGLDASVLDALCPPGRPDVLMLATLRSAERKALTVTDLDTTTSRGIQEVMRRARIIVLDRFLSPAECDRAEHERNSDPRIGAALDQSTGAGFAEYLAAAPAILARWQSARNGENLTAGAIISAAVDARRAGYLSPLPRDMLENLHSFYLDPREAHRPDLPSFTDGLTWTTKVVEGASSCLSATGPGTYQPFDYLVDHSQATTSISDIPEPAWPVLLTCGDGIDLASLAANAYRAGRPDISEAAWRRAAQAGLGAEMLTLSPVLRRSGRFEEAEQMCRPLAEANDTAAMHNLGVLLQETGRDEEAEQWYRRAADTGNASAMTNLGFLLHKAAG